MKGRRPPWGKIVLAALALGLLAAAWRYTELSEIASPERIRAWAATVRETPWAPLVLIAAYTPAVFVLFPRPLLTVLSVLAFGPWLGFAYSMTGILVAALATYYAGRVMRPETVERLAGDKGRQAGEVLRRHGLAAIFALRMVPVAPFAVEGILAGGIRIRLWHFMLGTFAGMAPGVLAETVFGSQLAAALEDPGSINYAILAAVVVAFVAIGYLVRRWWAKHAANDA